MISPLLIQLLSNKIFLGIAGSIVALIAVYFKGYHSAQKSAEEEQLYAERAQAARLRAAEAKNQFLEKQGESQNEAVNTSSTIDELMRLWNTRQSSQGPSSPSDPK